MNRLPSYNVDTSRITVSGLSAGAFMAHQLLVAYSDVFAGMGSIAGGPYLCAEGTLAGAITYGMKGEPAPNVDFLVAQTQALERFEAVAPLSNLKDKKIWLFHGTEDTTVSKATVLALQDYCEKFTTAKNIKLVDTISAPHTMPTDEFDAKRVKFYDETYIADCGYDAAGELLKHLHGKLNPRVTPVGQMLPFRQSEFIPGAQWHGMSLVGYVYLPTAALEGRQCGIHVALHGCNQYEGKLGRIFVENAGYNAWAEANDLIVLYPQAVATVNWRVFNPKGCWDWWGHDDAAYFTRSGRQQRAIVGMLNRLSEKNVETQRAA
jgi:poly(3-hydroxybutyrate) depolymerase